MAETKYQIRRIGNRIKLSFSEGSEELAPAAVQPMKPKKRYKTSIWSKIGAFFSFVFSILFLVVGFVIATPIFILITLRNWVALFISFAIFWSLVGVVYYGMILNLELTTGIIFNNTSLSILLLVSFIGAIFTTIGIRD